MTAASASVEPFTPDDPAVMADPYPKYDSLRTHDPVHYNPKGFWFLSGYDDVALALRDKRLSNRPAPFALLHARHRSRFVASDVAAHLMAFHDTPSHAELRRPLAGAFGKSLRAVEVELADITAEIVDDLPRNAPFDAVAQFAAPCALRTTARMIGLPEQDLPQIAQWSSDFFYMFHAIPDADTLAQMNASVFAFRAYITQLVSAPPQPGLIADLSKATPAEEWPSLVDNLMLLVSDGVENVRAGIATVLDILLQHPDVVAQIVQEPQTLEAAIDEALRLESPGQYQGRITLEPITIRNREIRSRSIVLLGYGAANRDPSAFEDPNMFRLDRPARRPLTFGMGPHACLGVALFRAQARAALGAILAQKANLTSSDKSRDWSPRAGHRWLATLGIEIEA